MALLQISDKDFKTDIGRYKDLAVHQPVAVSPTEGQDIVLISKDEYARLKRRDRQVLGLDDFTDADIADIEAATPSETSKAFDHECD